MTKAASGRPGWPVPNKWAEANYVEVPLADGGEGSLDAILDADNGYAAVDVTVPNALGDPTEARIGWNAERGCAFVESAQALGLGLIPEEDRHVLHAHSFGLGMMITEALDLGASEITLALGGSATNDGGAGMLNALGAHFYDRNGRELPPFPGGTANLAAVDLRDLDPRLATTKFRLALDVDNPLLGPCGASAVFGPQKGASPRDVAILDTTLRKLARAVTASQRFAAKSRGGAAGLGEGGAAPDAPNPEVVNMADAPGAGAAGGIGWAAMQVLGAQAAVGFDVIADAVGFDDVIAQANVVFTGEGRLDGQTMGGKTVMGVLQRAQKFGAPVVVFAGSLGPGWESVRKMSDVEVIVTSLEGDSPEDALEHCKVNLESAVWTHVNEGPLTF